MDLDRRPGAHRYINGDRIRVRRPYRTICRPCLPNPLLPGVYYLLSLPIYSLILFIYHTALDRQASEVPRYLVCTEKYPAGGAAPAFLPPSIPVLGRISVFPRASRFSPGKKKCSRLLRVHGTLPCMPWEAAGGLICTEKYPARRGVLPSPPQFVPRYRCVLAYYFVLP